MFLAKKWTWYGRIESQTGESLSINLLLGILTLKDSYKHVVHTSFHTFSLCTDVYIYRDMFFSKMGSRQISFLQHAFSLDNLWWTSVSAQSPVVWADCDLCRPSLDVQLGCLSFCVSSTAISGLLTIWLQWLARPSTVCPQVSLWPQILSLPQPHSLISLFLKYSKHILTPGPLHGTFSLPGMLVF